MTYSRAGMPTTYQFSHFWTCSAMILGFQGSYVTNFQLDSDCYCPDTGGCIIKLTDYDLTRVTFVTFIFFAVDMMMLE